jgi:hypothetical protein
VDAMQLATKRGDRFGRGRVEAQLARQIVH